MGARVVAYQGDAACVEEVGGVGSLLGIRRRESGCRGWRPSGDGWISAKSRVSAP